MAKKLDTQEIVVYSAIGLFCVAGVGFGICRIMKLQKAKKALADNIVKSETQQPKTVQENVYQKGSTLQKMTPIQTKELRINI